MHEDVVHRFLERVRVDALGHRQVALRVHVDAQDAVALLGERGSQVQRRRRLGDATLLVGERDDLGLSFHGGSDARLLERLPVGIRMTRVDSCMATTMRAWPRARASSRPGWRSAWQDKRILISLGAGGVGKTTTSAALALGLAMRGAKVAVVTIDPAPRLATALGLAELAGEPRRIEDETLRRPMDCRSRASCGRCGWTSRGPSTRSSPAWSPTTQAREEILANPVYRELSSAVAGSHELSAVAKLHELHEEHDFDVIVLDTPPSRNALDFLEAPGRLLGFLDGRALQVFLAPGGMTARLFGRGHGARLLDLRPRHGRRHALANCRASSARWAASSTASANAPRGVEELLRSPRTAFLIVTSPEREAGARGAVPGRPAGGGGQPAAELIVNRVHTHGLGGQDVARAGRAPWPRGSASSWPRRVAHNLADFDVLARRDRETIAELAATLDGPGEPIVVGQLDEEVQDLLGLARIAEQLLG